MKIKIFQTVKEDYYDSYTYSREDLLDVYDGKAIVDSSVYKCVYDGDFKQTDLERIFVLFNLNKPEGFTGHSMSPTDVIYTAEDNKYYFCENIGFTEVTFDENLVKETKIKVVYLQPDKLAEIIELDNDLTSMQTAVCGYIQTYYGIDYPCCIVCNDEAKINGMPLNRSVRQNGKIIEIIAGPFFICDCSTPNFKSLSEEKLEFYLKKFKYPELFFKSGKEILGIPYNPEKSGGSL